MSFSFFSFVFSNSCNNFFSLFIISSITSWLWVASLILSFILWMGNSHWVELAKVVMRSILVSLELSCEKYLCLFMSKLFRKVWALNCSLSLSCCCTSRLTLSLCSCSWVIPYSALHRCCLIFSRVSNAFSSWSTFSERRCSFFRFRYSSFSLFKLFWAKFWFI